MELIEDKAPVPVGRIYSAVSTPVDAIAVGIARPPWSSVGRFGDDALMARVAEGDAHAFAVLYRRHERAAASLAAQMCPRAAIAEEVVQEAFLSFWRSCHRFDRRRGSVRTWVLGIVRNRAIDVLRKDVAYEVASAGDQGVEEVVPAFEFTEGEVARRERSRELLAAVDDLPPEQGCVITLASYGGYTHTEIAQMLGTPLGTVKGRMRLGLRKMAVAVPANA